MLGAPSKLSQKAVLAALLGALLSSALPIRAESPSETVSFRNDVMAVLSKAGCNMGACHGNANGKAGFKLSLRGEDPEFDFQSLTRDQYGRRVDVVSPSNSLLLQKPLTRVAHEGGKRFNLESWEYNTLYQWIESGATEDLPGTPRLVRIEVDPAEAIVKAPGESQQLKAMAEFSDGTKREITRFAVYEPANSIAQVDPDGLARRQRFGETTILVRYLDQQVPARIAFIPERPGFVWEETPENNYVDAHLFAKLRRLQINPSELCRDEVFLRRAYLDLLGLLPSPAEAQRFVNHPAPDKRARLIDELLDRPEFADFWALKWADLLRSEERTLDQKGMQSFHHWIRDSLAANKPLDQFVRELLLARGSTYGNPPANFFRANRNAVTRAEASAQVFLGIRLQCAQCHNHPFDRWTQDDYYSWAAVFSKVQYKILENRRQDSNDSHEFKGEQIVYVAARGNVKNPRTGQAAPPRLLGEERVTEGDELAALAAWLATPENPYFARVQANRIWYHLMGRGIVDPIDDFRATNPASHPELLNALAGDFVRHRFDLRHLIRVIMNSRAYQLSSEPNDSNYNDELNYSRALVRRLTAEQLLDAQSQVLQVNLEFQGYPVGLRASELPGARPEKVRGRRGPPAGADEFLEVFGKPPRLLTCECERSADTSMSQAFQMISGPLMHDYLSQPDNRLAGLADSSRSDADIIAELYWSALTRSPREAELRAAVEHLESSPDRRAALEDVAWSLLNAKEFVLRR